jgi:CRISPR/Cas system-associated exonuclease Cas4 (RecB family)
MDKIYTFSPSEFAFGHAGCKRCYYDQKVNGIKVSVPFPSVFSKLDILQKNFYHDKSSDLLGANIQPGTIKTDYAKMQKSKVLEDNKGRKFQLKGKIDAYVDHKDFYSIIDFKVTNINEQKIDTYATQLLSYALMFEQPEQGHLKLDPIKNLGIFCFEPDTMIDYQSSPNFKMKTKYYDIKKDDQKMFSFITDVVDLLEGQTPSSDQKCSICKVRGLI